MSLHLSYYRFLVLGLLITVIPVAAQVQYVPLEDPSFPLAQVGYLKASNAEACDHFACGAATGINGGPNDNSAFGAGAVYLYVR